MSLGGTWCLLFLKIPVLGPSMVSVEVGQARALLVVSVSCLMVLPLETS